MTLQQLNKYFDAVFSAHSAKPSNHKFTANKVAFFEGKYDGKIYSLSCTVNGSRRVKYNGTGAPAEIPWDTTKLQEFFVQQMDAVFSALSVSQQAIFAPQYVAAKDFISRGKLSVAKQIIENTVVSDDLKPFKASILNYLQ